MAVRDWLQRVATPAKEGATPIKTVQLTAESVMLETWEAPLPADDSFFDQVTAILVQLAEESPKGRRISVLLTALTADGQIHTQCPHSITGKNAQADQLVGSGNNAAKAYTEAMEGITRVLVSITKLAEQQVAAVTKTNESLQTHVFQLHELELRRQAAELQETEGASQVNAYVQEQLKGLMPLALKAAEMFMESKAAGAGSAAAKVSSAGSVVPINGVKQ